MQISKPQFKKYIFVCENKRPEGACCAEKGERIRELLKDAVKARGLARAVRVSRSGCQDVCAEGPNVLLSPDNLWFKRVEEKDVPAIVAKAAEGIEGEKP